MQGEGLLVMSCEVLNTQKDSQCHHHHLLAAVVAAVDDGDVADAVWSKRCTKYHKNFAEDSV